MLLYYLTNASFLPGIEGELNIRLNRKPNKDIGIAPALVTLYSYFVFFLREFLGLQKRLHI